jgi:RNA ligase
MHYQFPTILNINTIRQALAGVDGFIEVNKDGYVVFNYVYADNETFPPVIDADTAIRRECRGIICDEKTGYVISRPLHKFFNLYEKEETQTVDLTQPHVLLSKVDGSFIRPFKTSDGILHWGTKMGETDISNMVKQFLAEHSNYVEFAKSICDADFTPVFEFLSRKQQIVIDYGPNDRLVLLAVRCNITGRYFTYNQLKNISNSWNIELIDQLNFNGNLSDLVDWVRQQSGIEGFVISFDDGHKVKLKCDEYVMLHKVKENVMNDRSVMKLIIDEKLDDLYSLLIPVDKERVEKWHHSVNTRVLAIAHELYDLKNVVEKMTKKNFALTTGNTVSRMYRTIMFNVWDNKSTVEDFRFEIFKYIEKYLTQQKKWDDFKKTLEFEDY